MKQRRPASDQPTLDRLGYGIETTTTIVLVDRESTHEQEQIDQHIDLEYEQMRTDTIEFDEFTEFEVENILSTSANKCSSTVAAHSYSL